MWACDSGQNEDLQCGTGVQAFLRREDAPELLVGIWGFYRDI